ncbi:hypothetical protein ACGFMK_35350 [Amycolatopsis sp. NPDC049252]|uniref:hypothetical protein n=1 Tax=Amycolatopsis sp. NPDC049252 TaxID=3363933 RepID=UPI003715362E
MGFTHADRRVVALATLDALRDAANRWVFPEQIGELEPRDVRWNAFPGLPGYPNVTRGVDVTGEPLRRGVASLEAHSAYLAALPGHPVPALGSKATGVDHAVPELAGPDMDY